MSPNSQQSPPAGAPNPKEEQIEIRRRSTKTITILGFVLSFIGILNIAGLVLSLIALIRSRRAGEKNRLAIAGLIIATCGVLFAAIVLSIIIPTLIDAAETCARLGEGVHIVGEATYTCTPRSFSVNNPW